MHIRNAVCYSLSLASQDVLAHLRLLGPLRQAGINIVDGIVNNQVVCEYATRGDLVVIQRDFPGKFDDYQKIVEIARREGKPIVLDMDDLLFFLPETHPARQSQYYVPSLLPMFQALEDADLVTVSTQKLKEVLDNHHDNVTVLPNYFDDTIWQFRSPALKKDPKNEPITIGYVGGNTHETDLEYITLVIQKLIKHYGQKLHFHFWGAEPPKGIRSLDQVTWTTQYYRSYMDFVEFFRNQRTDIFIAPLVDNLFNRCKSSVKFFDYSALGAPGVFSRLEPYSEVVTHGENGFLAESPDEWLDCIRELIEDHELRFRLAINAQETIRRNLLLSQNAFRWQNAYHDLTKRSPENIQRSDTKIIQSIHNQLFQAITKEQQYNQALLEQVRMLGTQLNERDQQVQVLGTQLNERDQQVQVLGTQLNEHDQQVQVLGTQLNERDQQVQALHSQLNEITTSKAWRMVTLLRRIRIFFLPPGSLHTRLIVKIISLLSSPWIRRESRNRKDTYRN